MPLYIVGTPIGNLEDITLRALRVLKEVDVVLCEDTRVTRKLLDHYDIKTPVESFHEHTDARKLSRLVDELAGGKSFALVTDAGTPGISDPGATLVRSVRERGIKIEIVPGPSALAAAVSGAGVDLPEFVFLGFLPHKKGRQTIFKEINESKKPVIFYESPHRILKTLNHLGVGQPKTVTIARELTKIHEEVISGSPSEVLEYFKQNPEHVRGEFVVVVA